MTRLELAEQRIVLEPRNLDRRVRPGEAQLDFLIERDAGSRDALAQQFAARLPGEILERACCRLETVRRESALDPSSNQVSPRRESDAESRQYARERMQQHFANAQRRRDLAGVLAGGTAEGEQREARRILAAAQRQLTYRIRHARHGHAEKGFRKRLGRESRSAIEPDLPGDLVEAGAGGARVERFGAGSAEHPGEEPGLDAAEHQVAVGDRGRTAPAVAGGTGIRARRIGADLQAPTREMQDRPTAGRDRVDVHHRRLQADAVHLGSEATRQLARVDAHVG